MEQQILDLINRQWTSPELDIFMAAMSSYALWLLPIIVTVVLVAVLGRFKARAMLVVMALTVGLGGNVLCDLIKKSVQRPRPREMLANVRRVDLKPVNPATRLSKALGLNVMPGLFEEAEVKLSRPNPGIVTGHSFPSAHAFNNFCIAMILAVFYRRWGWLYFIPAFAVAYSRVYVGAHWPSDVVAGAFLGCGVALLWVALLDWLWRTRGGKIMPKTHAAHPALLA
jgi:undecaprenyl-diphosphatase